MYKKTEAYAAIIANHIQEEYPESYPRAIAIQRLQEFLLWIKEAPHFPDRVLVDKFGKPYEMVMDGATPLLSFVVPSPDNVEPSDNHD